MNGGSIRNILVRERHVFQDRHPVSNIGVMSWVDAEFCVQCFISLESLDFLKRLHKLLGNHQLPRVVGEWVKKKRVEHAIHVLPVPLGKVMSSPWHLLKVFCKNNICMHSEIIQRHIRELLLVFAKLFGKWPTYLVSDISDIGEAIIVVPVDWAFVVTYLGTWTDVDVVLPLGLYKVELEVSVDWELDKALFDGVLAKILFHM